VQEKQSPEIASPAFAGAGLLRFAMTQEPLFIMVSGMRK